VVYFIEKTNLRELIGVSIGEYNVELKDSLLVEATPDKQEAIPCYRRNKLSL